jgi:hypothetical protein
MYPHLEIIYFLTQGFIWTMGSTICMNIRMIRIRDKVLGLARKDESKTQRKLWIRSYHCEEIPGNSPIVLFKICRFLFLFLQFYLLVVLACPSCTYNPSLISNYR